MARSQLAYVLIDTFPYNADTKAGDALRSSLPEVSQCGATVASRVAASFLHDMGMPELACYSNQEYHDKALQMVTDSQYKQKIIANTISHTKSKAWATDKKHCK